MSSGTHFLILRFLLLLTINFSMSGLLFSKNWVPEYFGFSPESEEAKQGLYYMLRDDTRTSGVPLKLYKPATVLFSPTYLWQNGFVPGPGEDDPLYQYFEKSLFLKRTPNMPLGMVEVKMPSGEFLVNNSCLGCHAGNLQGTIIAGLPNNRFDFGYRSLQFELLNFGMKASNLVGLKSFILTDREIEALDGIEKYYQSYIRPNDPWKLIQGQNVGPWGAWYKFASQEGSRDGLFVVNSKNNGALDVKAVIQKKGRLPVVDSMPWWHFKHKKTAFWRGDFDKSEHVFMVNHLDFDTNSPKALSKNLEVAKKQLDFVRQIEAPIYPGKIDKISAKKGYELFHSAENGCASCHGNYSPEGTFLSHADSQHLLKNVGTDLAYSNALSQLKFAADRLDGALESLGLPSKPLTHKAGEGYVAPLLTGVWATAPYFHNGSVPTLEGVLESSLRPTCWKQSPDPTDHYEISSPGLEYTKGCLQGLQVYDTRKYGASNKGHYFGNYLQSEDRRDLIEYLKTLH